MRKNTQNVTMSALNRPGAFSLSIHPNSLEFNMLKRFIREEEGATAIEYGLIAALIAVVIIGAVGLIGTNLDTTFNSVANHLV